MRFHLATLPASLHLVHNTKSHFYQPNPQRNPNQKAISRNLSLKGNHSPKSILNSKTKPHPVPAATFYSRVSTCLSWMNTHGSAIPA
jgi:hypothetical protein